MTAVATLTTLAEQINTDHTAARQHAREAVSHARRAGELLLQAQDHCPHGRWLPWLTVHCSDIAARTAQAYMRLARQCLESPEKAAELEAMSLRQAFVALRPPTQPSTQRVAHLQKPLAQPASTPLATDPDPAQEPDKHGAEFDEEELAYLDTLDRQYEERKAKIIEGNEPLRDALSENDQLHAQVKTLTLSRNGFMNGKTEITRLLKKEQSRTARLEREIERLKADIEALRERIAIMEEV